MAHMAAQHSHHSHRSAHEYGRPASIEDLTNRYFVHPLSELIVRLALKLKLHPNTVSLLGLGFGLLAGWLYYHLPQVKYVIGGFFAMIMWHILDGADGKLARATGKSSAFGRIIDGICDHLVFASVYIAFTIHLLETGASLSVWSLVVGAGVSHAIQAAGYEERRKKYQRRMDGVGRDKVSNSLQLIDGKRSTLAAIYDLSQKLVAGGNYGMDDLLKRLRSKPNGDDLSRVIVLMTRPMVISWGLLNANNRTILLFIFALVGQPIMYFLFEVVVLNFMLGVLMIAEWRFEKKLVQQYSTHIPD